MIGPGWLADVFAAIVIGVALFSAIRLAVSRGQRRPGELDADIVHVLMGIAMAGMFVPGLATLPTPAWEAVFAVGAVWFGWRAVQVRQAGLASVPPGHYCRYPLPHLIDNLAMLYMLWAVSDYRSAGASGGMSGMGAGAARFPVLGLVLALCVCGYVVWLGDRFQSFGPPAVAVAVAVADHEAAGDHPGGGAGGNDERSDERSDEVSGSAGAPGSAARRAGRPLLAPRAATCCKIAMGVAMGVMLVDLV